PPETRGSCSAYPPRVVLRYSRCSYSHHFALHSFPTRRSSDLIAEKLGIPVGEEVLYIRRVRSTGDTPVAVLENYIPPAFSDISHEELAEGGLYDALRERGVNLKIANQKIGARRAVGNESYLLNVNDGAT